jgi:hypothetical protein
VCPGHNSILYLRLRLSHSVSVCSQASDCIVDVHDRSPWTSCQRSAASSPGSRTYNDLDIGPRGRRVLHRPRHAHCAVVDLHSGLRRAPRAAPTANVAPTSIPSPGRFRRPGLMLVWSRRSRTRPASRHALIWLILATDLPQTEGGTSGARAMGGELRRGPGVPEPLAGSALYFCVSSCITSAARWGMGVATASYWSLRHCPIADTKGPARATHLIDGGFLRIRSSSRQPPGSAGPSYSPPRGLPRCLCPVCLPTL